MLNKVIWHGRLVADPTLRQTNGNKPVPVCNFRIAVDRDFKDKESGEKVADFFNCVAWRSTAEFVSKFFRKGSAIIVEGRLQNVSWEDDQGKHYDNELQADNAWFGDSKKEEGVATPAPDTPPAGAYPSGFAPEFS